MLLFLLLTISTGGEILGQENKAENKIQFMQITTVESVIGGGLGRSKMLITNPDGSQRESDMNNLFSLVGINFKTLKKMKIRFLKH